ncbi:MAG TPA: membrane dipeptidase [Gemmatimonadales bacterium]|nr:membrane dipeptidase [Gemmatimonadales bacterium]
MLLSLLRLLNPIANYRSPTSGPGVTLEKMRKGGVGVVLSPLYEPLDELGGSTAWILGLLGLVAAALVCFALSGILRFWGYVTVPPGNAAILGGARFLLAWTPRFGILAAALLFLMMIHNWLALVVGGLDELPGSYPRKAYMVDLLIQLREVERDIRAVGSWATVARDVTQLRAAIAARQIALVHAVEGAFHLGRSRDAIERNVRKLARYGVAYVTLAHLVWRRIASNAPAVPFLPDWMYRALAPRPGSGLTELGAAAVCSLVRHGILIDVTHMSEKAIWETFALLEGIEHEGVRIPVIATHIACRFDQHEYNLSDDTIRAIAGRKGVMGVIFCRHWTSTGLFKPKSQAETFQIIKLHIDRIYDLTNSYDHIALGSDLDGYIKPMLPGLEDMAMMPDLADFLLNQYGPTVADQILSWNALDVLGRGWGATRLVSC